MNKYYQSRSELDDITEENFSFQVYHSEAKCKEDFPNSEAVGMDYNTIEGPSFKDLAKIEIRNKIFIEAISSLVDKNFYISWNNLDENDAPVFHSDFAFVIFESNLEFPNLQELRNKIEELSGKDEKVSIQPYLTALLDYETDVPLVFSYDD